MSCLLEESDYVLAWLLVTVLGWASLYYGVETDIILFQNDCHMLFLAVVTWAAYLCFVSFWYMVTCPFCHMNIFIYHSSMFDGIILIGVGVHITIKWLTMVHEIVAWIVCCSLLKNETMTSHWGTLHGTSFGNILDHFMVSAPNSTSWCTSLWLVKHWKHVRLW